MNASMRASFGVTHRAPARGIPSTAGTPAPGASPAGTRGTFPFRADLDLAELDERRRPGQAWSGRGVELSRSTLSFKSRRLCYEGREVLAAIHLVDDRPVALFGVVSRSDYEGEGLYKTVISLREMPESDVITSWVSALLPRPAGDVGTIR